MSDKVKNTLKARKSPEFLKKSIIYQVFLRPFTYEGTIGAASELLHHIADIGADIIYLCPIFVQDDDTREEFLSDRQKKSHTGNPCNPYRIKDYYNIDAEYGTDKDLKSYVEQAHKLGIRVLLDLVYFHCGPTAVFLEEHPDYVCRDENGEIKYGCWHFPKLNFDNPELREYLWKNMEYLMKKFDVDGYRCDVASSVPVDFWEEGRRRIELIKPDCIMISEGDAVANQRYAFDLDYNFKWEFGITNAVSKTMSVKELRNLWETYHDEYLDGARFLRIIDNHDIASDSYETRLDNLYGVETMNAALLVNFMIDGVPFIYNGQEIADQAQHNLFDNRFYGKNLTIDWAHALTPEGKSRLDFIKKLILIRRSNMALIEGQTRWLENNKDDDVVSFIRETENQTIVVAANFSKANNDVVIDLPYVSSKTTTILEKGTNFKIYREKLTAEMEPYSFFVVEL